MNYYDNINNIFIKYIGDKYDKELYDQTLRVANNSLKIADSLFLNDEEKALAYVIAIVHNLGKYKNKDSINVLFQDKIIRLFITDNKYDDIIRDIVYAFESNTLLNSTKEKTILQYKILNDAINLDKIYVGSININHNITTNKVSANIINDFTSYKECKNPITDLDNVISNISIIFSLNYKYSFYVVEQEKYASDIIENLHLIDQSLINLFEQLNLIIKKYVTQKIGEVYHGW